MNTSEIRKNWNPDVSKFKIHRRATENRISDVSQIRGLLKIHRKSKILSNPDVL